MYQNIGMIRQQVGQVKQVKQTMQTAQRAAEGKMIFAAQYLTVVGLIVGLMATPGAAASGDVQTQGSVETDASTSAQAQLADVFVSIQSRLSAIQDRLVTIEQRLDRIEARMNAQTDVEANMANEASARSNGSGGTDSDTADNAARYDDDTVITGEKNADGTMTIKVENGSTTAQGAVDGQVSANGAADSDASASDGGDANVSHDVTTGAETATEVGAEVSHSVEKDGRTLIDFVIDGLFGRSDDNRNDDQSSERNNSDRLNVRVEGAVQSGNNVTIVARHRNETVDDATVHVNGAVVGHTDANGSLTVEVPDDEDFLVVVETDEWNGTASFRVTPGAEAHTGVTASMSAGASGSAAAESDGASSAGSSDESSTEEREERPEDSDNADGEETTSDEDADDQQDSETRVDGSSEAELRTNGELQGSTDSGSAEASGSAGLDVGAETSFGAR